MFLRAESFDYATGWVNIINNAVNTAKGLSFAPRWPVETIQGFITSASGFVNQCACSVLLTHFLTIVTLSF